jgi:SprT protein
MHKEIREAVEAAILKAESYFGESIPRPKIRYDLKGQTAGMSCFAKGYVRMNVPLAVRNREDFLANTVPHEIAHWVQRWKYGYRNGFGNKIRPHGPEWKRIMVQVYGLSPKRCHKYDTTETVTRRCRRYTYHCRCREHQLTSIRHNKMRKGRAAYSCTRCGFPLVWEKKPAKKGLTEELL